MIQQHPRPAALGLQCDCVFVNPNYTPDGVEPLLIRCTGQATVRMVIADPGDTYAVKRCDVCAEVLRTREGRGAMFKILSEEPI